MNKTVLLASLRAAVRAVPDVLPRLSHATRLALSELTPYKTYEFFLTAIEGLVNSLYQGLIGGIFIDTLANLISGQLADAYQRAWSDDGHFTDLPPYLAAALESMTLTQYEHVDQFYRDIIDARVDGTSIAPLLNRAQLWAGQWNTAYEEAQRLITVENGGNMIWREGDTEEKCPQCVALDGVVAYAREWEELGVHPKGFPNDKLGCKGGHCDCTLKPTTQRRSPKAYNTIMNAVTV